MYLYKYVYYFSSVRSTAAVVIAVLLTSSSTANYTVSIITNRPERNIIMMMSRDDHSHRRVGKHVGKKTDSGNNNNNALDYRYNFGHHEDHRASKLRAVGYWIHHDARCVVMSVVCSHIARDVLRLREMPFPFLFRLFGIFCVVIRCRPVAAGLHTTVAGHAVEGNIGEWSSLRESGGHVLVSAGRQ